MKRKNSIKIKVTRKKNITEDYDLIDIMSDNLIRVRNIKTQEYGIIDKEGKEVILCVYGKLQSFSEGLAAARRNHKWGYIDKEGNEVITFIYDDAKTFSEGLAAVKNEYGKWGCIDKTGKEVIPCIYDGLGSFNDGLAAVKKVGRYGYIDKTGAEVIPCIYDNARPFTEGLAAVKKGGGKWGFIDKEGKKMTPYKYISVLSFKEGTAQVRIQGILQYGNGLINKKGKLIVPCKYTYIEYFKNGLMGAYREADCFDLIDKEGNIVAKKIKRFEYCNYVEKENIPVIEREVTEEIYISKEREIPSNCSSIEIVGYAASITLNNGEEIFIEALTKEELEEAIKEKIKRVNEFPFEDLENSIKSTPLVRKLQLDSNNKK